MKNEADSFFNTLITSPIFGRSRASLFQHLWVNCPQRFSEIGVIWPFWMLPIHDPFMAAGVPILLNGTFSGENLQQLVRWLNICESIDRPLPQLQPSRMKIHRIPWWAYRILGWVYRISVGGHTGGDTARSQGRSIEG
jgi:hypothetical protein